MNRIRLPLIPLLAHGLWIALQNEVDLKLVMPQRVSALQQLLPVAMRIPTEQYHHIDKSTLLDIRYMCTAIAFRHPSIHGRVSFKTRLESLGDQINGAHSVPTFRLAGPETLRRWPLS